MSFRVPNFNSVVQCNDKTYDFSQTKGKLLLQIQFERENILIYVKKEKKKDYARGFLVRAIP